MKTKYIIFSAIAGLIFSTNVSGQKIDSYNLELPSIILEKGSPIYVDNLANTNPEAGESNFTVTFKNAMTSGLAAGNLAYEHDLVSLNPWMNTNLYTSTENKTEAKYVISGEYSYTTSSNKTFEECTGYELRDSLPFVYYKYSASSKATINGKITIADNDSQTIIKEYPFTETLSDDKTLVMEKPTVKNPTSYFNKLNEKIISKHQYTLNAVKVKYRYDFPKIKPENKDLKKEFREFHKELRKLAKNGNVNEMYTVLINIQQKEDSEDVKECIGMCYELIGNYTKAKTFYNAAGAKNRINHINKQISIQKQLNALNIETPEKEF